MIAITSNVTPNDRSPSSFISQPTESMRPFGPLQHARAGGRRPAGGQAGGVVWHRRHQLAGVQRCHSSSAGGPARMSACAALALGSKRLPEKRNARTRCRPRLSFEVPAADSGGKFSRCHADLAGAYDFARLWCEAVDLVTGSPARRRDIAASRRRAARRGDASRPRRPVHCIPPAAGCCPVIAETHVKIEGLACCFEALDATPASSSSPTS